MIVDYLCIGEQCEITIGIASSKHAYTGKFYTNRKDVGNMRGHRCKQGDTIGVEIDTYDRQMSVVLFSKNFRPIGTRYLTLQDHTQFYPTILIESNGDPVDLLVYWQTRVSVPPRYSVVRCFLVIEHFDDKPFVFFVLDCFSLSHR
jgi:hypothetical protein